MKREIRNSARALTDEMTRELLERGEFGVLSTVSKDGEPLRGAYELCFCRRKGVSSLRQGGA